MTHAIVQKQETRKLKAIVEIVNVTSRGVAQTNTPYVWNPSNNTFYFKNINLLYDFEQRAIPQIENLGFNVEHGALIPSYNFGDPNLFNLSNKNVNDLFKGLQEACNDYENIQSRKIPKEIMNSTENSHLW